MTSHVGTIDIVHTLRRLLTLPESDQDRGNDLAARLPQIASDLLHELERIEGSAPRYQRATRIPPTPNEAMLEHLRGLGYIGK